MAKLDLLHFPANCLEKLTLCQNWKQILPLATLHSDKFTKQVVCAY